jgi:hypothetical protein
MKGLLPVLERITKRARPLSAIVEDAEGEVNEDVRRELPRR